MRKFCIDQLISSPDYRWALEKHLESEGKLLPNSPTYNATVINKFITDTFNNADLDETIKYAIMYQAPGDYEERIRKVIKGDNLVEITP